METKNVIYEVNIRVQNDTADAFFEWLNTHVQEMISLPGFFSAKVCSISKDDDSENKYFTCLYVLESTDKLNDYFANHASAMRQDGLNRFGGKFTAERRILNIEKEFTK